MLEEIVEFIWNWMYWQDWAIVVIMLGSYFMEYGTVCYGTILLAVLRYLYRFACYLYRTDVKKEMEETIRMLLVVSILLTFLCYYNGTEYGLFLYGTIILWLVWLVLLSTFACYLYRTAITKPAKIRQLRKKIRDYIPNQWTARDARDGFETPSKVQLGVFGVLNSGKSSFLNSLHFAFKGNWEAVYDEKGNALDGGETMFRDSVKLNDNVTTFDTPGLVDLSDSRVPEVIAEITGQQVIDTRSHAPGEKIDCPIFILGYSSAKEKENYDEFLGSLVRELKQNMYRYPIMVVTFADNQRRRDRILGDIIRAGMAKGNVFFIENYTYENHEMDSEKHIALLEILETCIKRADDNISLRSRGEKKNPNLPHY